MRSVIVHKCFGKIVYDYGLQKVTVEKPNVQKILQALVTSSTALAGGAISPIACNARWKWPVSWTASKAWK
jgi:hypothetical protein